MAFHQPLIYNLHIQGTWDANVEHPIQLDISFEVEALPNSCLRLFNYANSTVQSWQTPEIISTLAKTAQIRDSATHSLHSDCPYEGDRSVGQPDDSEKVFEPASDDVDRHASSKSYSPNPLRDPTIQTRSPNEPLQATILQAPLRPRLLDVSSAETTNVSLASDPISLYKENHSNEEPPKLQRDSPKMKCKIPRPFSQKKPVPLVERPPWRPSGVDSGFEGRKATQGKEMFFQRLSPTKHSLPRKLQSKAHHRESRSMEDIWTGDKEVRKSLAIKKPLGSCFPEPTETLSNPSRSKSVLQEKLITHSESPEIKVEQWLDDKRNRWDDSNVRAAHVDDRFHGSVISSLVDSELSSRFASSDGGVATSGMAIPASPSPSSQAAIPWTKADRDEDACLGTLHDEGHSAQLDSVNSAEQGVAEIADSGGQISVVFPHMSKAGVFHIRSRLRVFLSNYRKGGYFLRIPGLPTQSGDVKGLFALSTEGDGKNTDFTLAAVSANSKEFQHQIDNPSHRIAFRLDENFSVWLLLFEEVHTLGPDDFEVDYNTQAKIEPEVYGDSNEELFVTYTVLCTLRLMDCVFKAEYVEFTIFLRGGPPGFFQAMLEPGKRRIFVENVENGKCNADHELKVTLTGKACELDKSFSMCFEKHLGAAPFRLWTPSVSPVSWKGVIFDEGITRDTVLPILPGLRGHADTCRKPTPRDFSYCAQAASLALSRAEQLVWRPENNLTPGEYKRRLNSDDPFERLDQSSSDGSSVAFVENRRGALACEDSNRRRVLSMEHLLPFSTSREASRCEFELKEQNEKGPEFNKIEKVAHLRVDSELELPNGKMMDCTDMYNEIETLDLQTRHGPVMWLIWILTWMQFSWTIAWNGFRRLGGLKAMLILCLGIHMLAPDSMAEGGKTLQRGRKAISNIFWDNVSQVCSDIETVRMLEDPTGWKNIMGIFNRQTVGKWHEGKVESEDVTDTTSLPFQGEELQGANGEDLGDVQSESEQNMDIPEVSLEASGVKGPITFRDKVDHFLGWKGPDGDW